MKVFLDPVTANKIQIHSNVPAVLFELMSKETIPREFGGESEIDFRHCVPWQDIQREFGHGGLSLDDGIAAGLLGGHTAPTKERGGVGE